MSASDISFTSSTFCKTAGVMCGRPIKYPHFVTSVQPCLCMSIHAMMAELRWACSRSAVRFVLSNFKFTVNIKFWEVRPLLSPYYLIFYSKRWTGEKGKKKEFILAKECYVVHGDQRSWLQLKLVDQNSRSCIVDSWVFSHSKVNKLKETLVTAVP